MFIFERSNIEKITIGRQTSVETREVILDLHRKGKSLREMGEIVGNTVMPCKKKI